MSVKEREKQEVLEKVREMTSGGSKGSKREKQVEGDTELSWDHEGLEPHPKAPRDPRFVRTPRTGAGKEQVFVKVCPKCR